ncbi:MAG: hypothetical protein GF334_12555 [Candidatus Altiarchaeales archaeon]|nr:hypothetical protein [Candidatus Altiarchaeales archaeon]
MGSGAFKQARSLIFLGSRVLTSKKPWRNMLKDKVAFSKQTLCQERSRIQGLFDFLKGRACLGDQFGVLLSLREFLKNKCKVYGEIGTYHGASLIAGIQRKEPCTFVGIDIFDGRFYDRDSEVPVTVDTVKENVDRCNKHGHPYFLVEGNSHDIETLNKVKALGLTFNLFLIDGDHSEDGAREDFEMYSPLISPGGFLVFDDYGIDAWPGVKAAVDSISFEEKGFYMHGACGTTFVVQKECS